MLKKFAVLALAPLMSLPAVAADARVAFFDNLGKLCGATFVGSATQVSADARATFEGKRLLAQVATCTKDEIRIPFIVGENRSRTWVFKRDGASVTLKHDHRHEDGTPDAQTWYGGNASTKGSDYEQYFHADAYTAKLIPAAAGNVWRVALSPDGNRFVYALDRDGRSRVVVELHRQL